MEHPKTVVTHFLNALNDENFEKAGSYLEKDFKFHGVMGSRNTAETYIADMRKMKFKYKIEKIFEEGNDVCVIYKIDMGKATIETCGIYEIHQDKLKSLKVIFDPRPVL